MHAVLEIDPTEKYLTSGFSASLVILYSPLGLQNRPIEVEEFDSIASLVDKDEDGV